MNTDDDEFSSGGIGEGQLRYSFVIRSPDYFYQNFHPYPDYAGWASATKLAEPFQKNNADHIRVGERLKLVAINRATGYIGSTVFTSRDPGQISEGTINDINSAIDDIVMAPPRLRIWAERVHEIKQGKQSSKDKTETNIIGNEGITLEDDLAVAIHTEWLDTDGRPFPAEMGDYGYTARLAKITTNPTPDKDALAQNTTNEFSIRPGRNLNVLKFNQKELTRHHYYVQVNPYPISEQNDFGHATYNPSHQNTGNNGEEDTHDLPNIGSGDESQIHPLKYRPAHYVPIQVPIYDEVATQLQNDANASGDTKPLYRWVYRPELQLSQYSFDVKSLIVNQLDENDNESTTNINIEEDEADFGPVFDEYTDSVELLFDLLGPTVGDDLLNTLPPLENDREFILSLGGEEAIATIGADGKVIFDNPDHLNLLTEEDLLSLRLYLNGDAGNVLWEYHMAGFGPFWSIYPNQQPHAIRKPNSPVNTSAATVTAADGDSYYMLGGMRIKILFQTEQSSTLGEALSVTWNVEDSSGSLLSDNIGNFYPDNNPASDSLGKTYNVSAATNPDEALFETYYQPEQWRTDLDVKITAQVRYSRQSTPKNYSISLKSRELYPVTADNPNIYKSENPQAPLKGSDVAMLEGLLWQLGISAQHGYPGGSGSRIDVVSPTASGGELSKSRNEYSTGFIHYPQGSAAGRDQKAVASLETMVRRLQGRYAVEGTTAVNNRISSGDHQDGIVDNEVLSQLKEQYNEYREAIYAHPVIQVRINSNLTITNIEQAWVDATLVTMNRAYNDATHQGLLSEGETVTRQDILLSWLYHEGQSHWGVKGDPSTPYRMTEGGGDEYGSLGLNQLLFQYVYGAAQRCNLSNYNNYRVDENIAAFVHYVTNTDRRLACDDTLSRMFDNNTADILSFNNATAFDSSMPRLRGYYRINEQTQLVDINAEYEDDDYDKLSKAVLGYNSGRGALTRGSWFGFLMNLSPTHILKRSNLGNGARPYHAFEYSIKVKSRAGMRLRTYILEWQVNETEGAASPLFNVGDTFCFEYGEQDWYSSELSGAPYNWWTTKRDAVLSGQQAAINCPAAGGE